MSAATVFIISIKFWFLGFMSKKVFKKQDFEIKKSVYNMRASEPWQWVMQVRYDSLKTGGGGTPYLRADNLKNHTLFRSTYLYSPYMGVPPLVKNDT